MPDLPPELISKQTVLERILTEMNSVLVAFSGGVDSTYLLHVAASVLGDRALAVTGDSESIPRSELENSKKLAESIGAEHRILSTNEMHDSDYIANGPDRCFHCKKTLFILLTSLAKAEGYQYVVEGSNLDDLSDYRPGLKAVEKYEIRSPLKEAGMTKEDIRALSRQAGLSTWDKPAAPCLSSRIPYGSQVTSEKLNRIEAAELYLRDLGFPIVRVRDHGQVARIEVPSESINLMIASEYSECITEKLRRLGYQFVSIDMDGFRSGSLNEVLQKERDE